MGRSLHKDDLHCNSSDSRTTNCVKSYKTTLAAHNNEKFPDKSRSQQWRSWDDVGHLLGSTGVWVTWVRICSRREKKMTLTNESGLRKEPIHFYIQMLTTLIFESDQTEFALPDHDLRCLYHQLLPVLGNWGLSDLCPGAPFGDTAPS